MEIWILWSHKSVFQPFSVGKTFFEIAPYASTIMICNICLGLFWHNDAVMEIAVQLNLLFWATVASLHCITTIYRLLLVTILKIWLLVINSVLEVVMLVPLIISPTGSTSFIGDKQALQILKHLFTSESIICLRGHPQCPHPRPSCTLKALHIRPALLCASAEVCSSSQRRTPGFSMPLVKFN